MTRKIPLSPILHFINRTNPPKNMVAFNKWLVSELNRLLSNTPQTPLDDNQAWTVHHRAMQTVSCSRSSSNPVKLNRLQLNPDKSDHHSGIHSARPFFVLSLFSDMAQPLGDSHLLSIPHFASILTLSSRWEHSDNGSIWSAWTGSSIKFYANAPLSSLFIRIGPQTQRKDRWNGGTPMFAVSVTAGSPNPVVETKTYDAEPGMLIPLWDTLTRGCLVEITLIDWASMLEIEAFISAIQAIALSSAEFSS
jgi:hypothetical protein